MSDQLILKFPTNKVYLKEDFYVSSSNKQAYDFINSWPQWIKRIVNIFGPAGSGKTHLASILKNKTTTFEIQSNKLNDKVFLQFKTKEVLIIENLDSKISENLLFSLWNNALQDNKYLLITSNKPINTYKFQLPDLNSRIKSCISFGIKLPDDDLISVILAKSFSDKQIKVEKKHIDYIIKRIDRSYEKISQFILILDKHSLKKGSPFSLKLIKEVLKMI
jgi:chromosomal replication initiation ATPase DnaA|tara:strand:+ start:884 stop:1543 length:660 start_codon:yes stop_codon:yes gene_type:complete